MYVIERYVLLGIILLLFCYGQHLTIKGDKAILSLLERTILIVEQLHEE